MSGGEHENSCIGLRKVRILRQFYDVTNPHSFAPDPTGGAYSAPPDPDPPTRITKCTKFGQLILRKIIKIVATRCQILRLKCTKFDFGQLDSRGLTSKAPTSKGASKGGRGREGREGRGEEGEGRGGKGRGGEGTAGERRVCLVLKLPLARPLYTCHN